MNQTKSVKLHLSCLVFNKNSCSMQWKLRGLHQEGTFLGDKRPLEHSSYIIFNLYLNELEQPLDYLKFSLSSIS